MSRGGMLVCVASVVRCGWDIGHTATTTRQPSARDAQLQAILAYGKAAQQSDGGCLGAFAEIADDLFVGFRKPKSAVLAYSGLLFGAQEKTRTSTMLLAST